MKVDQLFDDSPEDYYAFASDPLATVHTIWDQHKSIEDRGGVIL
jgi:hypothetical protein